MSRYIWGGWAKGDGACNLLTIPRGDASPPRWSDALLASARGEINYKLTDPRLSDRLAEKLETLRRDIEAEMRKRLAVPESPEEFARRCLFHASKIDYTTDDRAHIK